MRVPALAKASRFVIVRLLLDQELPRLEIQLTLAERQRNLLRNPSEPVERGLQRLAAAALPKTPRGNKGSVSASEGGSTGPAQLLGGKRRASRCSAHRSQRLAGSAHALRRLEPIPCSLRSRRDLRARDVVHARGGGAPHASYRISRIRRRWWHCRQICRRRRWDRTPLGAEQTIRERRRQRQRRRPAVGDSLAHGCSARVHAVRSGAGLPTPCHGGASGLRQRGGRY